MVGLLHGGIGRCSARPDWAFPFWRGLLRGLMCLAASSTDSHTLVRSPLYVWSSTQLPVPATRVTSLVLFTACSMNQNWPGKNCFQPSTIKVAKSSAPHSSEQIFSSCFITGLATEHCRTHGCSLHRRSILSLSQRYALHFTSGQAPSYLCLQHASQALFCSLHVA